MTESTNIQLYLSTDFKITIDYLSNEALDTDLDAEATKTGEVIESRRKKIVSSYKIYNLTDSIVQFTEFDRAVLDACIAEQSAGNEYTTPERLYHWLGGGKNLTDEMHRAIMGSIDRLASVRIEVEMETAQKKLGYGANRSQSTFTGYLMPTEMLEIKINGQPAKSAIHFLSKGIVFSVADMKSQIITCNRNLLEAPIRHSERGIALNHYIVRRTLEIKGSHEASKSNKHIRPLRKVISFDTMLKKCGMENANRDTRRKVKKIVKEILEYEIELGAIKSYSFETVGGGKLRSITLEF